MDRLHMDEDIFSPIRFDASLDISINSGGNTTNASNIECLFESPELKSGEQKNELMSDSSSFDQSTKLKKLELLNSPVLSDKSADSNISRASFTDLKENKAKNILIKENSGKVVTERNKRRESKQKETSAYSGQNEQKTKNIRPTTLLPSKNKLAESNTLKDSKKEKIARKSTLSKNSNKKKDSHNNNSVIFSEKNCGMIENSLAVDKNVNLKKYKDTCEKEVFTSNKTEKVNKSKTLTQHPDTSKPTSNLFQTQYKVSVEKIAYDHITLECDKIRQNTYMQQLSFYKELNKIKDEMERQHVATTKHLFKVIEELAQFHIFFKDKLRST